jgi:hypothetical protein
MKLTVYFDGQFYVGIIIIEVVSGNTLKAYRHIFGNEPKDQVILEFVNKNLLKLIDQHVQNGISVQQVIPKRINPKRLQRIVSKEIEVAGISTKAQEAIKDEYTQRKKENSKKSKGNLDELKQLKRDKKINKTKNKHKGR